jgi:Tfp pilus assembly protein PilN
LIKINLVPIDELENQLWWVPDAAVLVIIAFLSFFGAQHYLGEIQKDIDETSARAASLEENAKQLEPEIARFQDLNKKKTALNDKLDSLKKITVTKISRFEPVIVLEHFQNLKPEGVWFSEMKVGVPEKGLFSIRGQGFDNLLVAEFMTGIRATENQEKDDADLRTHIHFSNIKLKSSSVGDGGGSGVFNEMSAFPQFEISGAVRDKGETVPAGIGDPSLLAPPGALPPVSKNPDGKPGKRRF